MTLLGLYRAAGSIPLSLLSAEPQYKNLISIDVWTMIFTFCNLMIVFFFAKKFLLGPVKNMIDGRQKEVDEMYDKAEQSVADGERFKTEYEEKLKKASEESEAILRETVRNAHLREEAIIREARDEASAILKRADEQIEMERRQAVNDIKNDVSGMAVDIAGAVLGRDIKAEEHAELIDSFIDRLGENDD